MKKKFSPKQVILFPHGEDGWRAGTFIRASPGNHIVFLYNKKEYYTHSSGVKTDVKVEKTTLCPQCGYPQYCGCSSCLKALPAEYLPYTISDKVDGYECANCGFTAHCDEWLDIEMACYQRSKDA